MFHNEILKFTKQTVHTSVFLNEDPQISGSTINILIKPSTGIFVSLVVSLLISLTFPRETEENHVKSHRAFGRITNIVLRFQTSVCKISGLDLDPYSFLCTVLIDCTLLSAKCHRHLADTYRLSATAGSDVTQQSVKLLKVNYY